LYTRLYGRTETSAKLYPEVYYVMHFHRSSVKRTLVVTAAALLAITVSLVAIVPGHTADAATVKPTPFLTLPFQPNGNMEVLSGWYYNGGGFHGGIDFINGSYSNMSSWHTFAVIAAADGEACGNCTSRQGNAVWIKHNIDGATYYTYYGHLASISGDIPLGSQSRTVQVKRGQFLGWAGDTGARGILHLHFQLDNANSRPLDPYNIGKLRGAYPTPNDITPGTGWFLSDQDSPFSN
jgi:murein DD-endopeptidase MepM/ murein hydrolase activator NlpD